ncbi:hypothetical protein ABLE91_17060 [Aquabacter sp. CN5-332]|uniref:hypothetical protein n=1 Tax=Aquabacter sp. CN5-332 TaxID=3156608 RepID=UPI0032B3A198
MGALIAFSPSGRGPESITKLVWAASQGLLQATREGERDVAEKMGVWLANTREDARCTPALRRTIDRALEIALRRFGGTAPSFSPVQPDDGDGYSGDAA